MCACVSVCEYTCLHVNYHYNSLSAWIVMGTVVAVIVIMAGIVITILIIIIYVLWKRYHTPSMIILGALSKVLVEKLTSL